jgi:hypothetical protein
MNKDSNKESAQPQKERKFWKNKPMMKTNDFVSSSSRIDDLNEKFLYNGNNQHVLPEQMSWNIIEMTDEKSLSVVCEFLNTYYCEKNNIYFTSQFLNFVLGEKGFILSIVSKNNNALCGVVCVSVKNMIVYDKIREFALPNFLCAHPKFRKKGIAETMMNELIRYTNVKKNIQQGIFPSNTKLSLALQPCTVLRKYHRPINYNKLFDSGFMKIDGKENVIHNKFAVSSQDAPLDNYILMKKEHIDKVFDLYNNYMSQYNVSCKYTKEEFENLLLNNNIVKSYVITDNSCANIVDFVSYCQVQYKGTNGNTVNAGHIFLYSLLKEYGESMMTNLIKLMNKNGIDVAITNDDSAIIDTILSEKYNGGEDSDIETYEKVYEHKFLKKQKVYVNLFNWEYPFLTPDKVNIFLI